MKIAYKIALLVGLGASLSLSALAQPGGHQGPPGGRRGGPPTNCPPPAVSAANLANHYAEIAAYDANKDGTLDSTEQAALAQALTEGKLVPPGPPNRPDGATPPKPDAQRAQHMAARMAEVYGKLAPFDSNHDGQLDETEQAAVTKALSDGTLQLPRPPHPHGPGPGRQGPPPQDSGNPGNQ